MLFQVISNRLLGPQYYQFFNPDFNEQKAMSNPFVGKIFFELLYKFQRSFKQEYDGGQVHDLHNGEGFFSDLFTWILLWLVVLILSLFLRHIFWLYLIQGSFPISSNLFKDFSICIMLWRPKATADNRDCLHLVIESVLKEISANLTNADIYEIFGNMLFL